MSFTPYLLGAHLTTVTIAGLTVDGNGNYAIGAAQDIRAYISEVAPSFQRDLEDVRPIWKRQKNMVVTGEGHSLRLACLQKSSGAQVLRQMCNYDYVYATWVQGGEGYGGFYAVNRQEGGVKNRGGNIMSLDLEPSDPGVPQVSVTP